jgi:hypothetical protein
MTTDQAYQQVAAAYTDAYGRTQETPAGIFCRLGRLDRAYDIAANGGFTEKHRAALAVVDWLDNRSFHVGR